MLGCPLVGAPGVRVGEIGEPLDLGWHVGEPVELGGREHAFGTRRRDRELGGGGIGGVGHGSPASGSLFLITDFIGNSVAA